MPRRRAARGSAALSSGALGSGTFGKMSQDGKSSGEMPSRASSGIGSGSLPSRATSGIGRSVDQGGFHVGPLHRNGTACHVTIPHLAQKASARLMVEISLQHAAALLLEGA